MEDTRRFHSYKCLENGRVLLSKHAAFASQGLSTLVRY